MAIRRIGAASLVVAGIAAGCGGDNTPPPGEELALIEQQPVPELDVLFVIDNTTNRDMETTLRAAVGSLLAPFGDALPSLHVGLVTSDLGTSAAYDDIPGPDIGTAPFGCHGNGDNAQMQVLLEPTGDVAEQIGAMIAVVGVNGCGFEQTLEAAYRGLTNPPANFRRPEAQLAIVFLTDEDDCSLAHSALLGDDPALGALASFRCTQFGVICDEDMTTIGDKHDCFASTDETYLTGPSRYEDEFRTLVDDNRTVHVAVIAGDPTPVKTELRQPPNGGTQVEALAHSCSYIDNSGTMSVADPAVRINQVAGTFRRHSFTTACTSDQKPAMTTLGLELATMMGSTCLPHSPNAADDLALDCTVTDETLDASTTIPHCGDGDTTDCWRLVKDAAACPAGDHLRLDLERSAPAPAGTMTSVRCKP